MARPREQDIPQNLALRFDPKVRYLAELAARIERITLRDYIEKALVASFANVSLRNPHHEEPLYGSGPDDAVAAPVRPLDTVAEREHSLAHNADSLWHENPYARLEVIALARPHLLTEDEAQLWIYLHSRPELKLKAETGKGYRMDRKAIGEQWMELKAAAKKGKK